MSMRHAAQTDVPSSQAVAVTPHEKTHPTRVRPRVIVLIFATQVALLWWVADSEIARSIYLICYSLMMPTVLYLLFARILRRWLPFERQEILLGYIVLTATIPIVGFGGLRFLPVGLGYLSYFSESQPQWRRYLEYLPHLPVPHDPKAIYDLFRGGEGVPWHAWVAPILFWSAYLLLLALIWQGLAVAVRRIWIHQERMTFPITVLPLQITDPRDDLFRRPLFWLGFGIPAVMQSLLALHDWYPSIPAFTLKATDYKPFLFTSSPWNAIPDLFIGFYPMAIGLAYFVPSNISFSCWFFLLAIKAPYVIGAMFGLDAAGTGASRFPFPEEQAAGGWIGYAMLTAWGIRFHWNRMLRSLPPQESRAIRRRGLLALACFVLGTLMMAVVGVSPFAAAGVLAVYVAYVLSAARVRAEAGGMWSLAPVIWTPNRVVHAALGTQGMTDRALVASAHFDLVHVDVRAQSLPYLMEGLKIADSVGLRWRTVLVWVMVGTVTALAIGWYTSLTNFYALGAATGKSNYYALVKPQITMNEMDSLASNRTGWDRAGVMALLFGAGFTWLLAWLRMQFVAFPFHPVGYVLCNTYTIRAFLVPFFLAWLAKVLVQRFGGNAGYRRSLAFFVGLILGDIVTQAAWAIVGKLLDVHVYQFLS